MTTDKVTKTVALSLKISERIRRLSEETGLPFSYIARKALWLALRQKDTRWLMEAENED